MEPGNALVAVLSLAAFDEWLTEWWLGQWLTGMPMRIASGALGILLCILFQVDAMSMLSLPTPMFQPWVGQIVTGLIVGAGSAVVHKFFDKFIPVR